MSLFLYTNCENIFSFSLERTDWILDLQYKVFQDKKPAMAAIEEEEVEQKPLKLIVLPIPIISLEGHNLQTPLL